jgi:hypothetical protein
LFYDIHLVSKRYTCVSWNVLALICSHFTINSYVHKWKVTNL